MVHRIDRVLAGAVLLLALLPAGSPAAAEDSPQATEARNTRLVYDAFKAWREGRGSVFDLLADEVHWTVAGNSPVSGSHRSRQDFLEHAVQPITARLATPIRPDLQQLVAQDDTVVAIWDGEATAVDGSTYRNSYAWHMQLRDGQIVRVIAFLDTWALAELMK